MKTIQQAVQEYLALRRALGFKLLSDEKTLYAFTAFLEERGAEHINIDLTVEFAKMTPSGSRNSFARRLRVIRAFAKHWSAQDTRTEIVPERLFPYREPRPRPYIYSHGEIRTLVEACRVITATKDLRNHTYSGIIGLLAVAGLRIGEVLRLNDEHVDLGNGILKIEKTKFAKSRFIPLHPSTTTVLRDYRDQRQKFYPRPKTHSFFVSEKGQRLTHPTISGIFIRASRRVGLRKVGDSHGPRIHDLRHSFAVHTMIRKRSIAPIIDV